MLFPSSYILGGWIILNPPHRPEATPFITSFSFVSPDTGFIAMPSAEGENLFVLWKTTDGGLSFQPVMESVGFYNNVCCQFFNDTGYVYGFWGDSFNSPITVRLMKTTDGGNNWKCVLNRNFTAGWISPCLLFLSPDYGYVTVDAYPENLYRTSDGGITWSTFALPCAMLYNMCFVDTITGYVIGRENYNDDYERVWKTTNGGVTWQRIFTSEVRDGFGDVHEIQFPSRDTGYIADGREGHGARVYKTTDGGTTWEKILSKHWIHSMYFVANDTGYLTSYGKIFKTTNGRDFFRLRGGMGGCEIYPIHFIKGTQTGYLNCMWEGALSTKAILKTVDGGGNESLGFWQILTYLPEIPKKGVLLTSPPETQSLFVLEKGPTKRLWVYDIPNDSWYQRRPIPTEIEEGSMTSDWQGLTVIREKSNECWFYSIENDSWLRLPNIPGETSVKKGGCITSDGKGYRYVLKGGQSKEFWRFSSEENQWQKRPDIPSPIMRGGGIACDGEYIYAIAGGKSNEFWAYDIESDSWHKLNVIYGKGFKEGSCLAVNPYSLEKGVILAFKGGTSECWEWRDYWKLRPGIPGKKKIKKGAQLTVDEDNNFYAVKGKKMQEIWLTDEFSLSSSEGGSAEACPRLLLGTTVCRDEVKIANPTNKIEFNLPLGWDRVSIYDITGKLVKQVLGPMESSAKGGISLNIPQGVYFLRVKTANQFQTKKIVVTR